jgi:hypothetical protein
MIPNPLEGPRCLAAGVRPAAYYTVIPSIERETAASPWVGLRFGVAIHLSSV